MTRDGPGQTREWNTNRVKGQTLLEEDRGTGGGGVLHLDVETVGLGVVHRHQEHTPRLGLVR